MATDADSDRYTHADKLSQTVIFIGKSNATLRNIQVQPMIHACSLVAIPVQAGSAGGSLRPRRVFREVRRSHRRGGEGTGSGEGAGGVVGGRETARGAAKRLVT